jgi:actin-like ATPase involved in cell morphogenesis
VDSYGDSTSPTTSVVSIEKLEQQLEKSIEKKAEYLVGSTVYLKMKNGAVHKGVVIAEDDSSLTLESFRFGGRYSFKVNRKDIAEIIR